MGILGLSVFWCVISLLAISRLEKRLPSEMQEQLEFHATFSGLWPRTQPGSLGTDLLFPGPVHAVANQLSWPVHARGCWLCQPASHSWAAP